MTFVLLMILFVHERRAATLLQGESRSLTEVAA